MKYINNENIILSSIGLFSSWCFHKPTNTLFDCGDGIAQNLKDKIFSIDRIVLGHSHMDHISGLIGIIGLRNKTAGANYKPLDIWFDKNSSFMKKFIYLVQDLYPQESLKYPLNFNHIEAGGAFYVGSKRYIKAFKLNHNSPALGFCIYCESYAIKSGIDLNTIGEKIKNGEVKKEEVTERRDRKMFAYTLDNAGFDTNEISGVSEVVLDCTFLNKEDRKEKVHCTIGECEDIITKSGCKRAYLAHISPRYEMAHSGMLVWSCRDGLMFNNFPTTFCEISKQKARML